MQPPPPTAHSWCPPPGSLVEAQALWGRVNSNLPYINPIVAAARADRVGRARQDDQAVEHAGRVQVHDRRARRAHRVGLLRALLARRQQPAHRLRRLGPPGQGARPRRPRSPCQGAPGPSVSGRPHVARSARVRCAALPRARSGRGQHPGADWGCHAEPLSAPMRICASIKCQHFMTRRLLMAWAGFGPNAEWHPVCMSEGVCMAAAVQHATSEMPTAGCGDRLRIYAAVPPGHRAPQCLTTIALFHFRASLPLPHANRCARARGAGLEPHQL